MSALLQATAGAGVELTRNIPGQDLLLTAETLDFRKISGFVWQQKWELLRFLNWINKLDAETRRDSRA